jgi:hypothetical protein
MESKARAKELIRKKSELAEQRKRVTRDAKMKKKIKLLRCYRILYKFFLYRPSILSSQCFIILTSTTATIHPPSIHTVMT